MSRRAKHFLIRIQQITRIIILIMLLSACLKTGVEEPATKTTKPELDLSMTNTSKTDTVIPTKIGSERDSLAATITTTPIDITRLIIWVPPQFDPQGGSTAGMLLHARLQEYMVRNPQIDIVIRVKAESGTSSLLESLAAAKAAAPDAVPSIIALSRKDLENAAVKGLIYPVDGMTSIMKSSDWYTYSRQISQVDSVTYGIPFSGNLMLVVFRPSRYETVPQTWEDVITMGQPVAFPVADPSATVTLALYQMLGGKLTDDQKRPTLQPDVLKEVLTLYADGTAVNVFQNWLTQYSSDNQVWEVYREERSNFLITWSSSFLAEIPADSTVMVIPGFTKTSEAFTLADGWVWAFCDENSDERAVAISLVEYLVDSGFLADWSEEGNFLPTRPSALYHWTNKNLVSTFTQISESAVVQPSNPVITNVGPVLQEAVLQMINQVTDPGQAAQAAAEKLLTPMY